jgi:hypothetical protein
MILEFTNPVITWRGPSPYYFIAVPEKESQSLKGVSGIVSYGWGVIPVLARTGETTWKTSLIPKDGLYLLPLRDRVRQAEELAEGDVITVRLEISL